MVANFFFFFFIIPLEPRYRFRFLSARESKRRDNKRAISLLKHVERERNREGREKERDGS